MTPEEQEEYARRVAEGYGRLERLGDEQWHTC